jgi:integrase
MHYSFTINGLEGLIGMEVDAPATINMKGGDKLVTNQQNKANFPVKSRVPARKKKRGPHIVVKFGSAKVPVYRSDSGGRTRFVISHYRHGKRLRKCFTTLEAAKKEALLVAQQIQSGMQHVTDLKPHERETFLTARQLSDSAGVPLISALEDYLHARQLAGAESLAAMATEYSKHFGNITRRATVPEVVTQMLEARKQDGVGTRHLSQLRSVLNRFATAYPGQILDVTSADIDAWLRGLNVSPSSRNGMLLYVSLLFSFALERNYLPEGKPTASSQLRKVKVADSDIDVFSPDEFRTIIHAAPVHLIPLLAISAFAGIRSAELARLDWNAVDLDRRLIEIRAGQAKTASRRLVPITDNLAAWLEPLPRQGRVIKSSEYIKEATALARAVGIEWPRNVLRHSFITYRIAKVKSADQVALEAGNSASIIFKHYRELATEDAADQWFGILPKPGQWQNTITYNRLTRTVTLPE